ncbi:MAG: DNA-binding transcriptional dual regulator Crp [Candidatus Dependentiae bacterium ADurb.Bin331]|nr:MAG: DNA-binding transcriptional dual regulator Crp [Candidatus Dependentiae bacterium ADurb.Bin331]
MDSKIGFAEYLKNNSSLNQEEIELICSYFQHEFIKNETQLVYAGKKYKKIVFVVSGILRVFVIDPEGEEVVKNFIEPNCFFADIESIEKNQNSLINVSTVTDCTILTLSKSDADKLVKLLPKWEYLMKVGAMQAMNDMIRKQEFLRIGDSSDQYLHFVKHFPLLVKQVPLKYIASYLRITQSSLSRIRRQLE